MSAEAAKQYRDYAAGCLRIAQQAKDPTQRARLLAMAQDWQRLAETASKRENQ